MTARLRDALCATALAGSLGFVFGAVHGHGAESRTFWIRIERDRAHLNEALNFIARGDFEEETHDPRFHVWKGVDEVRVIVPGKLGTIEFRLDEDGSFLWGEWRSAP